MPSCFSFAPCRRISTIASGRLDLPDAIVHTLFSPVGRRSWIVRTNPRLGLEATFRVFPNVTVREHGEEQSDHSRDLS